MPFTQEEIYYMIISGGCLMIALGILIVIAFMRYHNKTILHIREKEQLGNAFQKEILRTQLEIQEQTFKTISQEIHDNIGQMLSLAKLNLNTLDFNQNEKAIEKINDAKELVGKAIQDLRDLSKTLNTETIATVGLMRAIEMELHMLQKTGMVQTHLELRGVLVKLDAQKELVLFRIVQEALHNIIKHANAAAITVTAAYIDKQLLLTIADDGCGFDSSMQNIYGSGLRNMQSRARLMNAHMGITSRPGSGTQIHISLPITN